MNIEFTISMNGVILYCGPDLDTRTLSMFAGVGKLEISSRMTEMFFYKDLASKLNEAGIETTIEWENTCTSPVIDMDMIRNFISKSYDYGKKGYGSVTKVMVSQFGVHFSNEHYDLGYEAFLTPLTFKQFTQLKVLHPEFYCQWQKYWDSKRFSH